MAASASAPAQTFGLEDSVWLGGCSENPAALPGHSVTIGWGYSREDKPFQPSEPRVRLLSFPHLKVNQKASYACGIFIPTVPGVLVSPTSQFWGGGELSHLNSQHPGILGLLFPKAYFLFPAKLMGLERHDCKSSIQPVLH